MNIIKNINDAIKREIKRLDKNNLTAFDQIAFLENEIRLMRETMDLMQEEQKNQNCNIERINDYINFNKEKA